MSGEARTVAGRYELGRPLGRGGMGAVWFAHDTLLGRDVAIKEIFFPGAGSEAVDPDDPVVRRALREAQAAARLRHPGIVTVHDVVTEGGRPWIVMELVNGRSLAEAIREAGLLSEQQSAEVGLRVLDALGAAHRQGVLHRDVKPANILLDTDRVVLTDFGIAAIDDATALTVTGQMVGSPAYMAPERINGQPATEAADLWALGVTLYTAVTGKSPFQREDTSATVAAILGSKPETPAHAGKLWPVIKGFLEKDPARRLTAEQARPLLAAVGSAPVPAPRRRRNPFAVAREGVAPTALAPPPTLAATTAHRPADAGPTVVTPGEPVTVPLAVRRSRRPRTLWSAAMVVLLVLVAVPLLWTFRPGGGDDGGGDGASGDTPSAKALVVASGPASPKPVAPVNPFLDACVVGTWKESSMQVINNIDSSTKFLFTGKGGLIMRVHPDGRTTETWNTQTPLTGTHNGARWEEIIRGTLSYRTETKDGKWFVSEKSGRLTYEMRRNGKHSFGGELTWGTDPLPYTCGEKKLTSYGDADSSTQTFVRLSHNP